MATAKPFSRMETAEHREPYDARVSRTVLGARRGDFPRATHQVVVSVAGTKHWLWWAVDQDGFVLDVLVQSRRNAKAARRLMRKLLKVQGRAPRVMITDKLGSYAVAGRDDAGSPGSAIFCAGAASQHRPDRRYYPSFGRRHAAVQHSEIFREFRRSRLGGDSDGPVVPLR